jgi:hypothetical protein
MPHIRLPSTHRSSAWARRTFLQAGAWVLGGFSAWGGGIWGQASAESPAARPAPAKLPTSLAPGETSVILLYLHGGPSQLETYDLKPEAPIEYRSVFRPIATNVPGMDICELFPQQARIADKFSLIRSLNHDVNIHSDGGIVVLTGKRPLVLDPASQSKSEHPDFGSVASKSLGMGKSSLPPYVAIPRQPYMTRPAYLGSHHAAFEVGDPSTENYRAPQISLSQADVQRLDDRRQLLARMDQFRRGAESDSTLVGVDRFRERAFELLTSARAAEAFNLSLESESLRDRYGRNLWGQGCLLARRLAEAGVPVISLFIDTPKNGPEFTNWDDHILNAGRPGHFGDFLKVRLPYLDQCLSAMIEDIFDRGLDRKILTVVMGEFGRTPRLSHNASGTGRDHWPQAYSALVSGGGLKMGQVIGATNSKAEYPVERPYSPQDLLATVYRHLKIDPATPFLDLAGRPTRILESGSPIREL